MIHPRFIGIEKVSIRVVSQKFRHYSSCALKYLLKQIAKLIQVCLLYTSDAADEL